MNHPDHSQLILAYLDGTLSVAEVERLNRVLLESAAARAQLRALAAAEVRLRELAAGHGVVEARASRRFAPVAWIDQVFRGGFRLPIAAGLAVGILGTSAVWAIVRLDSGNPTTVVSTLVAEGFETAVKPGNAGVPAALGAWGGDHAEIAPAGGSVAPRTGARMLRFLRSDFVGESTPISRAADQHLIIDLAPYRAVVDTGRAVVRAEAWFNQAAPRSGEEFAGTIELFAFGYDPRVHRGQNWGAWLYDEHLGVSGHQQARTDADPATWERLATNLSLPAATRFLIVHLRMKRTKPDPTATPVEFAGAYVDDVRAELLLPPASGAAAEIVAQ